MYRKKMKRVKVFTPNPNPGSHELSAALTAASLVTQQRFGPIFAVFLRLS